MRGIEKTEIVDDHSPVSIALDDDQTSSMKYYEMLNVMKNTFEKVRRRVKGIAFVDDSVFPGVQASDMISYEARRLMVQRKLNNDAEPSDLYASLTLLGINQPLLYTPEILDQLNAMPAGVDKSDQAQLGL